MDKLLGQYKNGNYDVKIYEDGTKVREVEGNTFLPSFPESIDMKITNKCKKECPWCHEQSHKNGKHGSINSSFINTLPPYTEIALGGGNVLSHPDLIELLWKLKNNNVIANITVNQKHFMKNQGYIQMLVDSDLIKGLGISVTDVNDEFIDTVKQYPNAVLHVINGVISFKELRKLYDKNLKILILGYKKFGRGENYFCDTILAKMKYFKYNLHRILPKFKVVSFDNLALEQLDVKGKFPKGLWNSFYMGDDGQYTMYVDLVEKQFAKSSTSNKRYELKNNIIDMFNMVRKENN